MPRLMVTYLFPLVFRVLLEVSILIDPRINNLGAAAVCRDAVWIPTSYYARFAAKSYYVPSNTV